MSASQFCGSGDVGVVRVRACKDVKETTDDSPLTLDSHVMCPALTGSACNIPVLEVSE